MTRSTRYSASLQRILRDTHVLRLSRRLGLSQHSDVVKLEFDLMEIVPRRKFGGWTMFSHSLVFHGRAVCKACKPNCPAANRPALW